MTVRVPNERDDKGTTKVDVRLPDGIYFLSYKKVPGWKVKVVKRKLDPAGRARAGLRGRRALHARRLGTAKKGGIIRPGQFEEFPLSVRVPDGDDGDVLLFPAVQTYQGGEKVRWTGAADADLPAPRVTLQEDGRA